MLSINAFERSSDNLGFDEKDALIKARVISYYLPQFHPTPENDQWWGKGFTEWTNVGKAKPLFKGHYQPRVPADLGYYDLRISDVREAQADLAREAGIEGFMYWHYWFGNGRRMLDRPFNEVLNSGKPNFPFCLGWANHSWRSDSWKNSSRVFNTPSLLIEQQYPGMQDFVDHFYAVLSAFQDNRYITYDCKPLFLIYSPLEIQDCRQFIDIWQNLAIKNGLPGIHFIGICKGWRNEIDQILDMGFDAVNRNGQWEAECKLKGKFQRIIKNKIIESFGGLILDKYEYSSVIKYMFTKEESRPNIYPTVLSQWDRSARSGRQATIYTGSSPDEFEKHLDQALIIVEKKDPNDRIIFLKSWNEWGEGNYVEPDLKYGRSYLEKLKLKLH